MNNFWNNVSRYPRFFVSSLIGSILTILLPLKNLFKITRLRIVIVLLMCLTIMAILFVLVKMTGS